MDVGKAVKFVLVLVAAFAVVLYLRMSKAADLEAAAREAAFAALAKADNYDANKAFYRVRAELTHSAAFQAVMDPGSRRTPSTVDKDKYLALFFEKLINRVRDENRQDLVRDLIKLRDSEGIARPG